MRSGQHMRNVFIAAWAALLLVKCGYERDVDVFDLVAAVEQEMTIGHLYPPGRGDRHERRLPVFHPGGFRVRGSA